MKTRRNHVDDLRGLGRLAVETTRGVTELVEAMHVTIGGGPAILGAPLARPLRIATAPVYGGIQVVTKLVGAVLDRALSRLEPLLGTGVVGREREIVLAAVNGVLGDHLAATRNPLAIEMRLHAPAPRGRRLVVLIHGSSMCHLQWRRAGHDHGEALARDLGHAALYVHYNSGLHVSTNGAALAALLDERVTAWPEPIDEITLVGHSMGGLVARSACHVAEQAGNRWRDKLSALVTIGTPHHGAPLERGGNWIDTLLGISRYSSPLARLGKIRSAGVTDLRWGNVRDEDWEDRDRFDPTGDPRTPLPLPRGVTSIAIAGTTSAPGDATPAGDGLVPVDSALGIHARDDLDLAFSQRFVAHEVSHLELLSSAVVYAALRSRLSR